MCTARPTRTCRQFCTLTPRTLVTGGGGRLAGVPLVDTLRSLVDVHEGASADSVLGAGAASLADLLAEFQQGGNNDTASRAPAVTEARVSAAHADDSLFD